MLANPCRLGYTRGMQPSTTQEPEPPTEHQIATERARDAADSESLTDRQARQGLPPFTNCEKTATAIAGDIELHRHMCATLRAQHRREIATAVLAGVCAAGKYQNSEQPRRQAAQFAVTQADALLAALDAPAVAPMVAERGSIISPVMTLKLGSADLVREGDWSRLTEREDDSWTQVAPGADCIGEPAGLYKWLTFRREVQA